MYENFPYSNFHDLNTDWIVKKIKDVETSEANASAAAEAAHESQVSAALSADQAHVSEVTAQASANAADHSANNAAASAGEAQNVVADTLNQVDLLQARVDNIIPSGTQTEGNTELLDIRVGYNGVTYPSAGDAVREQIENVYADMQSDYCQLPRILENVSFTENNGIVNRTNLNVYSEGESYRGKYTTIAVSEGEKYLVSGYSLNNTYPCCFGTVTGGSTAYMPLFLTGNNVTYTNAEVTIPAGVTTLYVNANYPDIISIKKVSHITQDDFEAELKNKISPCLKSYYDGTSLWFKKKSLLNSKDTVIRMGNSDIGNNLFTFLNLYYQNNTDDLSDVFASDGSTALNMGQTDWISPYQVRAVNNGDGDHPASVFMTGGNHRSNNSSSGGGKTATQNSLKILVDGKDPEINSVMNCSYIDVFVSNLVNGYNTSKDDGTGRNILEEKIHFHITPNVIEVNHRIIPLEDIVIERNYGLQIYYPGSTTRFIGGDERKPFLTNANKFSNNKITRDVIVADVFEIKSGIKETDTGSFEFSTFSYFTSGNKVYSNVIYNNSVQFDTDEEYTYNGYYEFN